jgi:hypothetical protein
MLLVSNVIQNLHRRNSQGLEQEMPTNVVVIAGDEYDTEYLYMLRKFVNTYEENGLKANCAKQNM